MGTDNQNIQEGAQTPDTKTFTQAELDAVVKDRLKREREKYSDYEDLKAKAAKFDEAEEANKTELQKVTERAKALEDELNGLKEAEKLRTMRAEVAKETGIPANLLTGSTEDECKAQAEAIKAFAQPQGYHKVRDSSGLSVQTSSVANGATTKAQFKDWFESNF